MITQPSIVTSYLIVTPSFLVTPSVVFSPSFLDTSFLLVTQFNYDHITLYSHFLPHGHTLLYGNTILGFSGVTLSNVVTTHFESDVIQLTRRSRHPPLIWLWRWLLHSLSKCQSLSITTVLFRTTFTWTIILNLRNLWNDSWVQTSHKLSFVVILCYHFALNFYLHYPALLYHHC